MPVVTGDRHDLHRRQPLAERYGQRVEDRSGSLLASMPMIEVERAGMIGERGGDAQAGVGIVAAVEPDRAVIRRGRSVGRRKPL